MIAFWLIAAAMVCAALAVILPPLLPRGGGDGARSDESEATVRVYRERLAELRREYDRGHMTEADHAAAEAEAKRELLQYVPEEATAAAPRHAPRFAMAVTVLMVPAVALSIYSFSGRPELLASDRSDRLAGDQVQHYSNMPPQQRIAPLEAYVAQHPDAPRAWSLLASAYRSENRYREAAEAFGRARATRQTADASLIARQAEALLLANDRRFTDDVQRLIDASLRADPRNPLGLMLAGHAAFTRGEMETATNHWRRLAEQIPESDPRRQLVQGLIARAQGEPTGADATASAATATPGGVPATDGGPAINVRLRLSEALREHAKPGDTVFVFARQAGADAGPPLAVQRTTVGALPTEIELSDAQAMVPGRNLSSAERVVVTARVSRSGGVSASSGDLEGRTETLATGRSEPVELTIDQRLE